MRQLVAQPLDNFQRLGRSLLAIHHHERIGRALRGDVLPLHQQLHHALHSHGEADCRRGIAAEMRDQAVVTAAGAHGILRTQRVRRPLEHRATVVVEAAHETRVHDVVDTDRFDGRAQRIEMRARFGVQMFGEHRRAADDVTQLGILAVENAQRIAFETPLAVLIQARFMRTEIRDEQVAIRLA